MGVLENNYERFRAKLKKKQDARERKLFDFQEKMRQREEARLALCASRASLYEEIAKHKAREKEMKNKIEAERVGKMFQMKKDGRTLDDIGKDFGVTRERVRQLISGVEGYKGLKCIPKGRKKLERVTKKCEFDKCNNDVVFIKSNPHPRRFCCQKCFILGMGRRIVGVSKMTHEQWLAFNNERTKNYYHRVLKHTPGFKDKVRKQNQDMKKKAWYKKWYKRWFNSPEVIARRKEQSRRKYAQLKKDPVRYEAYKERQRVRQRIAYKLNKQNG